MKQCILYALGLIPKIEDVLEGKLLEEERDVRSHLKKTTDKMADHDPASEEGNEPDKSRIQGQMSGIIKMVGERVQKSRPGSLSPGGFGKLPHVFIP